MTYRAILLFLFMALAMNFAIAQDDSQAENTEQEKEEEPKQISPSGIAVTPSHLRFNIEPGQQASRKVKVTNDTEDIQKFKVTFADFNMDGKGQSQFLPPGEGQYSLSKWTSVSPSFIELKPGERKEITVTVTIPNDEEARKAAWCVMMIEQTEVRNTLGEGRNNGESVAFGVIPTMAFGIYIYQNPPNVAVNKVEILDFGVSTRNDLSMLQLDVKNIGDGISYCATYVDVINLNTGEQRKLGSKSFTIVPGLIREFLVALPNDLPSGEYSAVGVVDFGDDEEIIAAELNFSVP